MNLIHCSHTPFLLAFIDCYNKNKVNGIFVCLQWIFNSSDSGATNWCYLFLGYFAITYKMQLQRPTFSVCNFLHFYFTINKGDSDYVPYTAFCARKSYFTEHEDPLLSFTKALQKGMDYVNSHTPEEIAIVIKKQFPETDQETITTIVTRYHEQDTWKTDLIFSENNFMLLQNILMEAGELEDYVPYSNLINTKYATEAAR